MSAPNSDHHNHSDYDYNDYSLPPSSSQHSNDKQGHHYSPRTFPILLPVFLLFFFLIGFFSIYLLHYLSTLWIARRQRNSGSGSAGATSVARVANHGLDPTVIASFPMFPYGVVRGLRQGQPGLECAVCISEFEDGDMVRLLTVCCHVFHAECIDEWLAKHITCPVCRSDLEKPPDAAAVLAVHGMVTGDHEERRDMDSHTIYIRDDVQQTTESSSSKRHSRGQSVESRGGRWQSSGDTVDDDRYTLRLTDQEEEHIASYHTRAESR